jgi:hypothetical protein
MLGSTYPVLISTKSEGFDVYQYLLGADIHEERSDSMLGSTYPVLISTKSEGFDVYQYLLGADIHEEHAFAWFSELNTSVPVLSDLN